MHGRQPLLTSHLIHVADYIHYSGNAFTKFAPNYVMSLLPRQLITLTTVNESKFVSVIFYSVYLFLMSHVIYVAVSRLCISFLCHL